MMLKAKKICGKRTVCVAAALLLSMLITLSASALTEKKAGIYDEVIRLHVIAESDSAEDQTVKLMVRDAVLLEAADIFGGSDISEAMEKSGESLCRLEAIANRVLRENGFGYTAKASFGRETYPTREYAGGTYPAGEYYSLRIVLGSGEGQNWWCVLFPPLCLGSSGGEDGENTKGTGVKFRFRIKLFEFFGKRR